MSAWIRIFIAAAVALACSVSAQAQPPASAFARLPNIEHVSISPGGDRIAYVTNEGASKFIVVMEIGGEVLLAIDANTLRIEGTFWHSEDLVMLRVGDVLSTFGVRGDVDYSVLFTANAETGEVEQMVRRSNRIGFNPDLDRVAGLEAATGRFLMALRDDQRALNLLSIDPITRRQRLRARGTPSTRYWIADATGERYVQFKFLERSDRYEIILHQDGGRRQITEATTPLIDIGVPGFTVDGLALAVTTVNSNPRRTRVLQRLELSTGEISGVLFEDPAYDFGSVRLDPYSGAALGVSIERERRHTIWFDDELERFQTALETAFNGAAVTIVDWSRGRERFIIHAAPADTTPTYFLFDRARMHADPILSVYPELLDATLPARRAVQPVMRDGMRIDAYLTTPRGPGPHPFVVLPHGGPAARDVAGFDDFAHFLASRGFGVIQPNFRGSDGYGAHFERAGHGEWGLGRMQHDLTDTAGWIVEQGLADRNRICIAGASYGGYAALAGAAFTPELYACAVSINAVSDLNAMIDYASDRFGHDSQPARYWRLSMTGSLEGAGRHALLDMRSPSHHADAISIPVLLMHGEDDTVVPQSQSRAMERALRRAGADVRYVPLDGGDHWLTEYPTRLAVFEEMERFLVEQIGG
ncbi:MAG: prolyl oligopeptidase family serine peptidase [Pseudomonadota bacterium]